MPDQLARFGLPSQNLAENVTGSPAGKNTGRFTLNRPAACGFVSSPELFYPLPELDCSARSSWRRNAAGKKGLKKLASINREARYKSARIQRAGVGLATTCPLSLEAIATINRPITGRFEGDFGGLATRSASCGEHLAWAG